MESTLGCPSRRCILSLRSIIKATSGTNDACPQASHLAKPIVLDFKEMKIKATDNQCLNDVKGFTEPLWWMLGPAGSEHHILTTPSGNKIFGATQFHNPVPPAPPTLGWLILELDMLLRLLSIANASQSFNIWHTYQYGTSACLSFRRRVANCSKGPKYGHYLPQS